MNLLYLTMFGESGGIIKSLKGLLPLSSFWGHENCTATATATSIPSITKNATGSAPFALSVSASATTDAASIGTGTMTFNNVVATDWV